jgi:uncharacterized membrane protein
MQQAMPARTSAAPARIPRADEAMHAPAGSRVGARGRTVAGAAMLLASAAYPVIVYLALGHVSARWMALLPVALALARAWASPEPLWFAAAGGAALLAAAGALGGHWAPVQLYPALVNLALFVLFASSLWRGPSVVERVARLHDPALPPEGVAYTRRVTQVWCVFFVVNGSIAAATALWASPAAWALYNGGVAYGAMGLLMGGEWLVRRRVRARFPRAAAAGAEVTHA